MSEIASVKKLGGRTAIVGCGSRGQLFLRGVVDRISNPANKVVAFCDVNEGRVKYYNRLLQELGQPVSQGRFIFSRVRSTD
jgi:predicted dehydrogenase